MGNPGRELPGFLICNNDQSTLSETVKIVITIGSFNDGFQLVVKAFSYGDVLYDVVL